MLRGLMALAALTAAAPASAQKLPDWLLGSWCTDPDTAGRATCETWVRDKDRDVLIGRSEAGVLGGPAQLLERMRIAAEGGRLVFHADPTGQEGGDFIAATGQPARSLRFENAAHDYPQVVRYWRDGATLRAEISLADGSKARNWTFRRKD
ncbi:MAG: hypothetical protein EOP60_17500 [Sphingomonadales bacterium]|nr:MAG: hypothetical protein EOP60_17500 [Sphingomonadales bacterium]